MIHTPNKYFDAKNRRKSLFDGVGIFHFDAMADPSETAILDPKHFDAIMKWEEIIGDGREWKYLRDFVRRLDRQIDSIQGWRFLIRQMQAEWEEGRMKDADLMIRVLFRLARLSDKQRQQMFDE